MEEEGNSGTLLWPLDCVWWKSWFFPIGASMEVQAENLRVDGDFDAEEENEAEEQLLISVKMTLGLWVWVGW